MFRPKKPRYNDGVIVPFKQRVQDQARDDETRKGVPLPKEDREVTEVILDNETKDQRPKD